MLPRDRVRVVAPGRDLYLGEQPIRTIESPSQTKAHTAFYFRELDALYVGDVVGLASLGGIYPVTPPPYFDFEATLKSLARFEQLTPGGLLFSHFGVQDDGEWVVQGIGDGGFVGYGS